MAKLDYKPDMVYYTGISLRNFKGFHARQEIQLAPLTFLIGPNSSGKSSIGNALLFIAQSRFSPLTTRTQRPTWIGPLVDLGSYSDVVFNHKANFSIDIGFDFVYPNLHNNVKNILSKPDVEILLKIRASKNDPIGKLSTFCLTDRLSGESIKLQYSEKKIRVELLNQEYSSPIRGLPSRQTDTFESYYSREFAIRDIVEKALEEQWSQLKGRKAAWRRILTALSYFGTPIINEIERVTSGRGAPRRWYSIAELSGSTNYRSYEDGLSTFSDVDPQMLTEQTGDRRDFLYRQRKRRQPPYTIEQILNRLDIASAIKPIQLSPYHSAINVEDNITKITSNLIDVGYGASQVIPVIRASMSTSDGPLFVEQPEIHLHPKAQSTLAEILCELSVNRQVIIETHSVHMINRARLLIAEGRLAPRHVIINFVTRSPSGSRVYPLRVLQNGDFANEWPSGYGFFDERYQDTMRLLHLKNQNSNNSR